LRPNLSSTMPVNRHPSYASRAEMLGSHLPRESPNTSRGSRPMRDLVAALPLPGAQIYLAVVSVSSSRRAQRPFLVFFTLSNFHRSRRTITQGDRAIPRHGVVRGCSFRRHRYSPRATAVPSPNNCDPALSRYRSRLAGLRPCIPFGLGGGVSLSLCHASTRVPDPLSLFGSRRSFITIATVSVYFGPSCHFRRRQVPTSYTPCPDLAIDACRVLRRPQTAGR